MPSNKKPKGILIAIGGAVDKGTSPDDENNSENLEEKFLEEGILKRLLKELSGKTNRVEIITTASLIPEETGQHYIDAFIRLGNENIDVIHIKNREDAHNPDYLKRINQAEGILFTGGNQLRLTTIFGGTELLNIMLSRYQNEHFIVAGTSAGAMVMSTTMIFGGSSTEALLKGEVKLSRGFGFIEDVTFDTHFIKRGRFGRLCQTIATNPIGIGIGLGEDTGLLITNGDHMEAIGSGLVMIIEGGNIKYTNIADIEDGEPISIENLTVHVLSKGHNYILSERRMV
ncbi:cyanophycinase [Psychroflexus sp. MES1-P1E]|jgi:cyanophycinase|uniref:cyanophycinase n=1 Tax=Psychroflexus sp. MES1-P1E TaxID=2058320 RepID=UPI000C7BEA9E|nr:cyanophycinase [Psychroflexus sp. MES1-P1E]PKG43737.1 cyanophycinase [Psychroflexus sp. MES1-P1E]